MKNSTIEWCDHTFNAWEGCTKVSQGCANCYAESRNQRFHDGKNWGPGAPRLLRSDSYWKEPLKWDREAEAIESDLRSRQRTCGAKDGPEWHAKRPRVFCSSLADWLDEEGPIDQLARLFGLIHDTPNLDWLLLTKRPQNWWQRLEASLEPASWPGRSRFVVEWLKGNPPANVWIGTTVEDQQRADERIPELLKIPAKVLFLSCEPLLSEVKIFDQGCPHPIQTQRGIIYPPVAISWVICGGESGKNARPMHPIWARSLRYQCQAAGVPFFMKQNGEFSDIGDAHVRASLGMKRRSNSQILNLAGGSGFHGDKPRVMNRVGKKAAGRLLDGREWNEFPEVNL